MTSRRDELSWRATMAALEIGERAARSRPTATAALVDTGIRAESLGRSVLDTVTGKPRPRVHHWDSGTGSHTTAGPLLLLNGWTASGAVWPSELLTILQRRHRVIRIDNRGSGRSAAAPAPFTIADLARDAHDVIRRLDVPRATVVGLSMGGMIAQELALRWPGDVGRLVLMSTRPPAPMDIPAAPDVMKALIRPKPSGVRTADYLRHVWSQLAAPGFAESHPELLDELVASVMTAPTRRGGVMNQARAIAAWRGAHRLARLRVPTTIVHGDKDVLIPVDNGRRLAQAIPDPRYIAIAGVGHILPYEALSRVAEIILASSP